MNTHSSGYYSIDEEYTIIGFNDTAKEIYPNLQKGIKCYKALMGLDSPCPPCPVMNKIYGPRTYLDPIRKIYETVDAVELKLSDEKVGHAMVFSTVAEGERLASAIPTGEKALRLVGAINLLASDYVAVYGVSRQTGAVSVYRSQYQLEWDEKSIDYRETNDRMQYDILREAFIKKYVHPDEQAYMFEQTELSVVQERLSQTSGFKLHCRIKTTQTHYYYLMIARDGEAESYENFVIALVCEDDDVSARKIYEKQLNLLIASIADAAGYFHMDVTADKILNVGGTSQIAYMIDQQCSIDEFVASTAKYIPSLKDRQDFIAAYCRESMLRSYQSGQVEIVRVSRCYYDDDVARISRYAARLFVNPSNDHLEAVLYGKDITAVQEAYETQVSIVKTLSSNYLNVYLIHSREKTLSIIKQEDYTVSESDRKNENVYSYEAFFDKYINECVYPEDRLMMQESLQFDNAMEALSGEKEYKGNYRTVKEGKIQYYQFRFIRDEESGIIVLGFLNVDDVVAKEIHQKRLLQEALSTAKRANAAKSNFLSRMSHDMRTPLNGIIGLLEIDKKHEEDTAFLKKNREKANIAANHLLSLINDVLDMSKIEEGELVLSHEPFNVIEQGREVMTIISMQAHEQGLTTVMEVEPEVYENPYIYGSPLHLSRAMMNIYSNCIKYNKENGEIRTHVRLLHSDEKILTYQWTISDTGIGISEDYLNRIFEPFTQEGTDARSVYQGTGLGMSIAKALFEQMGGNLEVFSKLGEGSTFVITLPFERAQELKTTVIEKTERESIQDIKILLAEDNELNQEVARILLEEEGAKVFCVNNGQKAVEAFSTHPAGSYDLILMDIMMPVMGGYEATRQIRRLDRTDAQSIPIIALTANAFAEDIQHAMDAGMNAHAAKPLNIKTIKKIIINQLK
nr:ATP-binding protein [uncultured Anaerobutyricum sp.]